MIGRTISHYKILEKLGGGGMGIVYKAWDQKLDRAVAIKFLPSQYSQEEESKKRFINEAKSASALDHPNIATIYEINETEEQELFIVMALYEGETLKKKIARGPPDIQKTIDIIIQIAEGLKKAHQQNIVHRDIKPANIIITNDGVVKIVDFGLAKFLGDAKLTKSGTTLGTVAYMSPEQAQGKEVDIRSDIWSLGVVLYEMLTGRLPFRGEGDQAVIYSIINEQYEPLAQNKQPVPFQLSKIIDTALDKNPDRRYQNLQDMIRDIKGYGDMPPAATASLMMWQIRHFVRKSRIRSLLSIAAFLLILLIGSIYLASQRNPSIRSIAIMPFENVSGDPDLEYLCEGLADNVRNNLSYLPDLKIIASSYAGNDINRKLTPAALAEKLQVRAIFRGQLRQYGDKLLLKTELIDTRDNRLLWGGQHQLDMAELFHFPNDLANQISEQLRLRLTADQSNRLNKTYTKNTTAYQFYLRGLYQWNKFSLAGYEKAIECFRQSLREDADYALAYVGLAFTYTSLGSYHGNLSPAEAIQKAKAAVNKALELDDEISDAYVALGSIKLFYDWDWSGSEQAFLRALKLNPNSSLARQHYGVFLSIMGRTDEAIIQHKKAIGLNPLTPKVYDDLALSYTDLNKFAEAIKQWEIALELDPGFFSAYKGLGLVYFLMDSTEKALKEFRKAAALSGRHHRYLGYLGWALGKAGQPGKAMKIMQEIRRKNERIETIAIDIAKIYIGLGENSKALNWLEKSYSYGSSGMILIKVDPYYRELYAEPRFRTLLRKMKFQ
ncbi:MAG: protein kinase [Calditrichaeota bacterium]|nr:protein kinase [Calditrichota bacterium]